MNKYQNKKVKTLILENNRGITPKYIEHGGITVLNQKCIRDNKILFEYSRKHDINKNNINPKKFLKKFDVLINSTGVGTLGRVAQLKRVEEPITYDSHISLLRPDPTKINLEYFGYAIGFKQNEIELLGEGSTGQTELKRELLTEIEIPVPPIQIQKKIVEILSSLDDKIELNRQMNQTLEAMARAIFKSWFVDFDPVYAKIEGRDYPLPPEIMELFPDELEESELGLIPKGWRVGELGEYVKVNNSTIGKDFQYDEINYIDISSVQEGEIISSQTIDKKSAPSRAKRIINHGDIIWSCVRPNRRSFALVLMPSKNTIVSTGFAVITPMDLPYTFVYSIVSRNEFSDYLTINATGSAYPAVKPQIFEIYKFVFPDEKISLSYHAVIVDVFQKIKNNFDQIETLASTRDLILPKIINGEFEV
jgi:type I restriction enzyme S subunit